MGFTAGEWYYYDKAIQVTDDNDNDTLIAWIQKPFTDEGEANAALIAAAPEMLAMLLDILSRSDLIVDFDGGSTHLELAGFDPENLLRLIAKAKGEIE